MRSRGNVISNTIHNPDSSKHPVPLSGEDSDSLMERYIRNKYEHKLFMRETAQPQNSSTSSISSGASSSTSGLSLPSSASSNASFPSSNASTSSSRTTAPPTRSVSAGYVGSRNPPMRSTSPSSSSSSKVSQVLGLGSIPYTDARQGPPAGSVVFPHGMVAAPLYQDQLQSLKDMGFKDERKIMEVLKSVNGKIIEASEILVRVGNDSSSDNLPVTAGISIQKSGGSANPFDALDRELPPLPPGATEVGGIKPQNVPPQVVPQQQQISTGYQNSYQAQGPAPAASYGGGDQWFDAQQQGQQQVGGNATYGQQMQGQALQGFAQQPQQPIQAPQTNPYASLTAGAMFAPTPVTAGSVNTNGGTGGYNPFFSNSVPPMQPPALQQNPYLQQQQQAQQQQLQQQQEQLRQQQLQQQQEQLRQQQLQQHQAQQQEQLQQLVLQQQQAQLQANQARSQGFYNAHQIMGTATPSYSQQPQMNPYQSNLQIQQPFMPQRAGIDKSSILALYNYPQLAPPPNDNPVQQQQQESQAPVSNAPQNLATRFASGVATSTPVAPGAGSNNPFLPAAPPAGGVGGGRGHMSQESVDFGAWQSGRHSPDAFASLSFRQ